MKRRAKKKLKISKPIHCPKVGHAAIKVVGVGGGGGNAITRMMSAVKLRGVEFIAINTDAQDLNYVRAHRKLYIGRALTKGLGAGMNPEIGKQAVEENRSEIAEALEKTDIVFITAGFGGGTGTGGGPIIAEIAREKGILTVGIITKPFTFEGAQRMNIAQEGIARFKDKVDALVVIPNDRIFNIIDKNTSLTRAFSYIDDVLKNAVQAVADIINTPGIINVDFADIKTIMKDAGTALVGIGMAAGPERGVKAVNLAVNSPLLEVSIEGAKGVLFSVAGGRDLKMIEVNEVAKAIAENLDANAKVIFGAYHDHAIKDKQIKVTVIATGFNGLMTQRLQTPNLFLEQIFKSKDKEGNGDELKVVDDKSAPPKEDVLGVPAFLRKRKR
jgi:cell division protein FtsZ